VHALEHVQPGVAGHDDRLDRVAQQGIVLLRFDVFFGDILGQGEGHHKVHLIQRVAQPGCPRCVLQHRFPPLHRLDVVGVDQVRPGAKVDLVWSQRHHRLAQPIVDDDVPFGRAERPFHHPLWDVDARAFAQFGPSAGQSAPHLWVMHVQAGRFENLCCSVVQLLHVGLAHQRQAW
jgi:hypothetical protein